MVQDQLNRVRNVDNEKLSKQIDDSIYLMNRVNCPAILVECGFLSNYQEEQKLRDSEYQKKICAVIASSVCTYMQAGFLLT